MIETKNTPIQGMAPVVIEWVDAAANHGFHCPDDDPLKTTIRCIDVGFLVEKTRQHVKIAMGGSEVGQIDSTVIIPRSCITAIDALEVRDA
jgi:hypothetical protein